MTKHAQHEPQVEAESGFQLTDDIENLFCCLFGKQKYHQQAAGRTAASWRRDSERLFTYLEKSVFWTVQGDDCHRDAIVRELRSTRSQLRNCRNFDNLNLAALAGLARLAFLLLGELPDHWDRKSPWHYREWALNSVRTFTYTRSPYQACEQVLRNANSSRESGCAAPTARELHATLHGEFKGNVLQFLAWVRQTHPALLGDCS